MLKPICFPCQRFYRPEKNGFYFIEGMPVGGARVPAGTEAPDQWKPYKLWAGDKWTCQGCGHSIIVGTTGGPIAEHFQAAFDEQAKKLNANYQVNDC